MVMRLVTPIHSSPQVAMEMVDLEDAFLSMVRELEIPKSLLLKQAVAYIVMMLDYALISSG